ncbi:MAG: hypothetical protein L0229_13625, partial [Blastocatellia bacterium]|nr:hypothetical protein [Blastocatellia bacterium]
LENAKNIYLVRTYAYVAAGKQGLVILDIENPEKPRIDQVYNADGKIKHANDVKVGMTNASLFAYIADGEPHGGEGGHTGADSHDQADTQKEEGGHHEYGLRIVQLISPEETPGHFGFSPRPTPHLIASFTTHAPALAISEGIDRDRAVDENGNQLSVFGRRGARPMNHEETLRMYMRSGSLYSFPEIKDNNIKQNRDIRNFFGPPRTDAAREATPGKETPEEKSLPFVEAPRKSENDSGQARLNGDPNFKPGDSEAPSLTVRVLNAELFGLAALFLPLGIVLFQRRKRGKK